MQRPQTENLLQRFRQTPGRAVLFWFCLPLCVWFFLDAAVHPLYGAFSFLALLPAVLMAGMAFALLFTRRTDPSACLLALYVMALAALARDNVAGLNTLTSGSSHAAPLPPLSIGIVHILWMLAVGTAPLAFAWLYSHSEYEPRHVSGGLFPLLVLLACAVLGQVAYSTVMLHETYGYSQLSTLTHRLPSPYHRLLLAGGPLLLAQALGAVVLMLGHYRQWGEKRNQALTIFLGVTALFLASAIINDTLAKPVTTALSNLTAYAVPVLFVYMLERHTLFDIQIALRRTVQYALAKQTLAVLTLTPLVMLAFLLGWGSGWRDIKPGMTPTSLVDLQSFVGLMDTAMGELSNAQLGTSHFIVTSVSQPSTLTPVQDTLVTKGPFICTVLAGAFALMLIIRLPLLRWLDRTYFRETHDAQLVLGQVGRSLLSLSDVRAIAQTTLEGIDTVLHPTNAMVLAEEEGGIVCLARRNYTGYRPPLWPDAALLSLERMREVPDLTHRAPAAYPAWITTLPEAAITLLKEAKIRLVVPLPDEDRVVATLLLGEKASGLPYAPEDNDLLVALSSQVGLALQSARLNQEFLKRRTQELTTGSVSFVEVVEKERRLLAADLHDQTLPELRGLLTDLQALAEQERQDKILKASRENAMGHLPPEKMVDQLRQTIQNIRDIMESLRPSALEVLGLAPAVENELRKATGRCRPPIVPQFHAASTPPPGSLNPFEEMSVFRIAQEAVNNACRHARANKVRVEIDVEGTELVIVVDDDGAGLPPETQRNRGRGLDNMRYRASLIGARIAWDTPDWGCGTRVELRAPLPSRRPSDSRSSYTTNA